MNNTGNDILSADALRVAAYYHWQNRGCPAGDEKFDWYAAQLGEAMEDKGDAKNKDKDTLDNDIEAEAGDEVSYEENN